jgi:hypothetical protein
MGITIQSRDCHQKRKVSFAKKKIIHEADPNFSKISLEFEDNNVPVRSVVVVEEGDLWFGRGNCCCLFPRNNNMHKCH